MDTKRFAATAMLFALCACATAQENPAPAPALSGKACPADVQAFFKTIVGDWTLSIQADEGWTGYGRSRISWAADKKCGLIERSVSVFNAGSEDALDTSSTSHLVYDELSETIKVLSADNRGYAHIGLAAVSAPFNFQILKPAGEMPNRRIQYRNLAPGSFEWSWQGRTSAADDWVDRLVIGYEPSS